MREAAAEIETATGAVVHAFTTGAMVQVFLLNPEVVPDAGTDRDSIERADDDGFRPAPESILQNDRWERRTRTERKRMIMPPEANAYRVEKSSI